MREESPSLISAARGKNKSATCSRDQCDSNTKHLSSYVHFIVPCNMDSHKKVLRTCSCLNLTIISKHLPLRGFSSEPFSKLVWGQIQDKCWLCLWRVNSSSHAIRVSIDRAADSHLVLTYSVSWSTVKQLKCFSSNVNSKSLNAIHAHFRIYGATLFISYLITLIKYTQGNP